MMKLIVQFADSLAVLMKKRAGNDYDVIDSILDRARREHAQALMRFRHP